VSRANRGPLFFRTCAEGGGRERDGRGEKEKECYSLLARKKKKKRKEKKEEEGEKREILSPIFLAIEKRGEERKRGGPRNPFQLSSNSVVDGRDRGKEKKRELRIVPSRLT